MDLLTSYQQLKLKNYEINNKLYSTRPTYKEYYKNEKQIKKNKEIRNDIVDVRSDLDDVKKSNKTNNSEILN